MTPAARVQAAIEILDLVIAAALDNGPPADRIVADWFRSRRFAGSGDRRAVRDLVYRAIRVCGDVPANGRTAMMAVGAGDPAIIEAFDGSRHAPSPLTDTEFAASPGVAPAWLVSALAQSDIAAAEAEAMQGRAPLDIRVNTLKASRDDLVLPEPAEHTLAPNGLRLASGTAVEQWDVFRAGQIEVQDAGSQLACLAVDARPGETVVDLCAGAGGKTLALAAAMGNRGTLIASDTDRSRLSRLAPRMERAGVSIAETVLLNPQREAAALAAWQGRADAVLVDAPCSGTGTWRRNPEARWRLSPASLERNIVLQARLLDLGATLVRPGGRLIYVTCSLLDGEGAAQVDGFLTRLPDWRADQPAIGAGRLRGNGTRLTPFHDGTDGFFIARLVSP